MNKAFVLGAGLGERLRPLTDQLPKPLVPVFGRPLITYAFDHLLAAGVREFVVNTHHLPEAYQRAFPEHAYRGSRITFRNESPARLETAGGIANVLDLIGDETFIVYNGDVLTDLPLAPLIREHQEKKNMVTLALRSSGPALHIAFDPQSSLVTDIRNKLGTGNEGQFLFTGIYVVDPAFFSLLTPGKIESVIPIFLQMIQSGARLGGIVLDEGHWWDLGNRESYLGAHREVNELNSHFPLHLPKEDRHRAALDATAQIAHDAVLEGLNVIGARACVASGARLRDCIVWPEAFVEPGADLHRCIVRSGMTASGKQEGKDI